MLSAISSGENPSSTPTTRSREQLHWSTHRRRREDAHAALVEQAIEQTLDGNRGVDQFVVLDGLDEALRLDPGIVLAHLVVAGARRRVAAREGRAGASGLARRAGTGRAGRRPARRGGACRPRGRASRRRRGGPASGSARTGGNRCARRPRGCRPRAARCPGSGWCRRPGRWSWRACRCPRSAPGSASPLATAPSTAVGVEAGVGAHAAAASGNRRPAGRRRRRSRSAG